MFDGVEMLQSFRANLRSLPTVPTPKRDFCEWQETDETIAAFYLYSGIQCVRAECWIRNNATAYTFRCKTEDRVTVTEQLHDANVSIYIVPFIKSIGRLRAYTKHAMEMGGACMIGPSPDMETV